MASITFKGNPVKTSGSLPAAGSKAPDFLLTKTNLSDFGLQEFAGKKVILNIFPSLDTGVCAASVRRFNKEASSLDNTVVLCISKDLPFAHKRFCETEGLANVVSASSLRNDSFEKSYQVTMQDGPLAGLFSRSVVVIDEKGLVTYSEQVPEITQEPNFEAALQAAK
ncbi:MAG: thiol peroxidase [Cytophagaceae bacterium]|jgi:thiol peroxidase|nr:thiol peroxidase [Cytophagaceae bacterium]